MTAVSGAWAQGVLNLVVDGTTATIKYDGNASNNPYFTELGWKQDGDTWDEDYTTKPTITTVTIDGSCKNFSGTNLTSLFTGFSGLTTINGLENLNTANVQDMSYMFYYCMSLTSLDLSSWNTARVTMMYYMFSECSKLTTVDLSGWNTENVGATGGLFYNCSNLENIYVGDGWSTAAVIISDGMFYGCTKLLSMNTANPAIDKTNAHTGDGGYLKVKPAADHVFSVAESEHGSGTVKFFVDEKEVKGANEDDVITMTVTPDEGYVVGSVSANAYTTWAGARRTATAAIPMLGNVTLTPVEGKANTWTFTMPAANVELKIGYLATSNLYLSKDALADKANIAVTAGETTVEFDDDGKSKTTVIEGTTVTTKYNGTKKILGMKVEKKVEAPTYTLLSAATTDDIGKVVCAAGHLHDAKTAVPDGCTAVGILGKVTETGHGLILALHNANSQNWNTINGWTSASYAGTTLKVLPDDDARGINLTSYSTLGETAVSNWAVAQKSDYEAIFTNLGSTKGDSDGNTYDANVNAYITTGVGGTAISGRYWSATERDGDNAWDFHSNCWASNGKTSSYILRAVLGF